MVGDFAVCFTSLKTIDHWDLVATFLCFTFAATLRYPTCTYVAVCIAGMRIPSERELG